MPYKNKDYDYFPFRILIALGNKSPRRLHAWFKCQVPDLSVWHLLTRFVPSSSIVHNVKGHVMQLPSQSLLSWLNHRMEMGIRNSDSSPTAFLLQVSCECPVGLYYVTVQVTCQHERVDTRKHSPCICGFMTQGTWSADREGDSLFTPWLVETNSWVCTFYETIIRGEFTKCYNVFQ